MELHLVGIIIGVVVVISGSAIRQMLDSLCSSLVGDGLLGWSNGIATTWAAVKLRNVIYGFKKSALTSSRRYDLFLFRRDF
jgi:hypothetical protein